MTVRGILERPNLLFVSLETARKFPAPGLVKEDVLIRAGGGQMRPVWGENHAGDPGEMVLERMQQLARLGVPKRHLAVPVRGGKKAFGRHGQKSCPSAQWVAHRFQFN